MSSQVPISVCRLLCLTAALWPTTGYTATDAEVLTLIDSLRPTAETIVVDGDLSDWGAIPFFDDPTGDGGADSNFDISSFAIAPISDGLLFAITTVGVSPAVGDFVVGLDFARGPRSDLEVGFDATGNIHALTIFDDNGQPVSTTTITGLIVATGAQTLEIEIPNSALAAALPIELADALAPGVHRSWVRSGASTESALGVTLDDSPSVASFRLIATPFALDPPLPTNLFNSGETPVALDLPVDGRWFVGQGANGSFTHLGSWSYDLTILNDDLKPSIPDMSLDNDDYFAFGAPFFAPASGTVTFATGSNPDNVPFTPAFVNNEVQIDIGGGFSVRLLHAKQNTTLVSVDEAVDSSTQIAEVGNSGFSFQTHLHMDVFEAGLTYPIAFRFVDVALNPVDDPWERQISSWEPRDGFFVTVPEPSSAILSITGIATVLVLAGAKSARD